jgi:hypothetical protein
MLSVNSLLSMGPRLRGDDVLKLPAAGYSFTGLHHLI